MRAGLAHDPAAFDMRPLGPTFGVELTDFRIAGDLPEAEMDAFRAAHRRHGVLLLRDVPNDPAALVAFSQRLGRLGMHSASAHTHPDFPEIFCVGNDADDRMRANFATGVEQWHADSSFRDTPSARALFYGAICPSEGGETRLLDAVTAYAELPPALRAASPG